MTLPGQLVWLFTCEAPTIPGCFCGTQLLLNGDAILTRNVAVREARRAGWSFAQDGTTICPHCAAQPRPAGAEVKDDWRPE